MKKGLLVVLASLILVASPALLCAQGFLPGLSGLPGGWFGGSAACGQAPYGARFLDPLSLYVGWGDTTPEPVSFYFDGQQLGAVTGLGYRWNVRGIWLGVAEKANFGPNAALGVEAWWLIPTASRGTEPFNATMNIGAVAPLFVTIPAGTNWDVRPDWWFIDGRFMLTPYPSNFMLFAGFRYDHFSTRFESSSGGLGIFTGNADVTVNSYIPYVGGEYKAAASGGGNILIRVLGFPWVPGSVQHGQTVAGGGRLDSNGSFTNRGYFFEVFAEYDWNVIGAAGLGAFVRWNVLQGRGAITTDLNPVGTSVTDNFSFYRNNITVGGKVTLDFGMPF